MYMMLVIVAVLLTMLVPTAMSTIRCPVGRFRLDGVLVLFLMVALARMAVQAAGHPGEHTRRLTWVWWDKSIGVISRLFLVKAMGACHTLMAYVVMQLPIALYRLEVDIVSWTCVRPSLTAKTVVGRSVTFPLSRVPAASRLLLVEALLLAVMEVRSWTMNVALLGGGSRASGRSGPPVRRRSFLAVSGSVAPLHSAAGRAASPAE